MTQATKSKTIDQELQEKRDKLQELAVSLSIYMQMVHPPTTVAKVGELQDRLEFRVKEYEKQLLDEKIGIYKDCLKLIKR